VLPGGAEQPDGGPSAPRAACGAARLGPASARGALWWT
jgi:hypothetical protein